MANLTQNRIKELLEYNQETGVFVNKVRRANQPIGKVAGCVNAIGYIKIAVDGRQYLAHRLAWLYIHGEFPEQIDHMNCNRGDNRIANLRPCSQKQNTQNIRGAHCDSYTGLLGIYSLPSGRFRARIMVDGVSKHLGCFDTKEAAYNAYLLAKTQLHSFTTLTA